ncbi:MAG: endonuclease/exonuclease/phosphatase family protein [Colwellia sp.]
MYTKTITFFITLCLSFLLCAHAQSLKIASWNIAWLGSHKLNTRTVKDYIQLALYAKKLDADIIALQEVENADYARKVFGENYDYYFSTENWVQRIGVAVKKSLGYSVKAVEYKALNIGKVRPGMDITLVKGNERLRLLAVHLKSGCFSAKLDEKSVTKMKEASKSDNYKKVSCTKLSQQKEPLEQWIDARASENVPFIVLGDFNRQFSQDINNKRGETEGLWQVIDDEGNEHLWSPTLSKNSECWGGFYKNYIDYIVLSPRAKLKYIDGSFNQLLFEGKFSRKRADALSDHCPISVVLNL